MTMQMYVGGVGLLGPGLAGWEQACAVLIGAEPYLPAAVSLPAAELLPPAERRRTGQSVKLALAVGMEALVGAGVSAAQAPSTIFTSSGADGVVIHEICEALARPEREVSPTRFHNSVHNAPAGYWSIALRSHAPSTSLCAYDWSFAAGLIEAGIQLAGDREVVLLVSYDLPYPEPLGLARPMTGIVGAALLLRRAPTASSLARIDVEVECGSRPVTQVDIAGLEALRAANPTGRALPLLRALAGAAATEVVLDYLGTATLAIKVTPAAAASVDAKPAARAPC